MIGYEDPRDFGRACRSIALLLILTSMIMLTGCSRRLSFWPKPGKTFVYHISNKATMVDASGKRTEQSERDTLVVTMMVKQAVMNKVSLDFTAYPPGTPNSLEKARILGTMRVALDSRGMVLETFSPKGFPMSVSELTPFIPDMKIKKGSRWKYDIGKRPVDKSESLSVSSECIGKETVAGAKAWHVKGKASYSYDTAASSKNGDSEMPVKIEYRLDEDVYLNPEDAVILKRVVVENRVFEVFRKVGGRPIAKGSQTNRVTIELVDIH